MNILSTIVTALLASAESARVRGMHRLAEELEMQANHFDQEEIDAAEQIADGLDPEEVYLLALDATLPRSGLVLWQWCMIVAMAFLAGGAVLP